MLARLPTDNGHAPTAGGQVLGCTHRVRHRHGTRAAYVAKCCHCGACRGANRAEAARRSRAIAYGRWQPWVDAAPVRAHVELLRAAGLGPRRIAQLAGVPYGTLARLIYGGSRRMRPTAAQRLFAVAPAFNPGRLPALRPGSRLDAAGARRRLQALVALGWTQAALARQLGRDPSSVRRLLRASTVTAAVTLDVSALYERLADHPPSPCTTAAARACTRARSYAAQRDWGPPLAWDDIDHDPAPMTPDIYRRTAATPDIDPIAVERATYGDLVPLTAAERREAVRRLRAHGHSVREVARRLHTSARMVTRVSAQLARASY